MSSTSKRLLGLALLSIQSGNAEDAGAFLAQASTMDDCEEFLSEALSGIEGFVLADVMASTSSSEPMEIELLAESISKGADSILKARIGATLDSLDSDFDSLSKDEEDDEEDFEDDGDGFLDSDDEDNEPKKACTASGRRSSPLVLNMS